MTEPEDAASANEPTPVPSPSRLSAGAQLRQMREAAGVDVGLLSSAMKVSRQKLEALEGDRLDELPNVTFARALASAICRAFGVDPAPVLERMPVAVPDLRVPDTQLNQRFRGAEERPAPMVGRGTSKLLLLVIAVLVIGAAALWLLPTLPIQLSAPPEAAAMPASAPDGMVREEGVGLAPEQAASTEIPASPASPASAAEPELAQPASVASASSPAPAQPQPQPQAQPQAQPQDQAQAQASGDVLGFVASSDTWVGVSDAAGKKLIDRLLTAGQTLAVNGDPPLSVVVGRKDAVTVTVRGQPFDIKTLSPSSVARFKVE